MGTLLLKFQHFFLIAYIFIDIGDFTTKENMIIRKALSLFWYHVCFFMAVRS